MPTDTTPELPALPEPYFGEPKGLDDTHLGPCFVEIDMRAYALAAIAADRASASRATPDSTEPKPESSAELAAEAKRLAKEYASAEIAAFAVEDALDSDGRSREAWVDLCAAIEKLAALATIQASAAPLARPVSGEAWISVDERLPDEEVDVWIAAWAWNDPEKGRIYGRARRSGEEWRNPQDEESPSVWWAPTHWQPLPAAPTAPTSAAKKD